MLLRKELLKTLIFSPFTTSYRSRVKILPNIHGRVRTTQEEAEDLPFHERPYSYVTNEKKFDITDVLVFLQTRWKWRDVKEWFKRRQMKTIIADQVFSFKPIYNLGPNLAAVHFVLRRNGKVKLTGNHSWLTEQNLNDNALNTYNPNTFVEEIDLSGSDLLFEGFDNLSSLKKLKLLDISNCEFIDDWSLQRSYLLEHSLQHLNISGCHKVTDRGICTLHRLRKLKTLIMKDMPNVKNKELVALLLQDVIPGLKVIGINYNDPSLLKRVEEYMV